MRHMQPAASLALSILALLISSTAASTLRPPILPLIVRNPYLSTWLQDAREPPWSRWPMFYTGQEIGFGILVSVPEVGVVYPLLGRPHDSLGTSGEGYNVSFPTYTGSNYDASVTNLTYLIPSPGNGDPAEITLSFLSPITPTSTLRQSIPASYITVHVSGDFNVDLYIDLNGQWVSGNRANRIEWNLERTSVEGGDLKTWSWNREVQQILTEWDDRAEWGRLLFTGPPDAHHESGTSALIRKQFASTGKLRNQIDSDFRAIMDEEPVFAFSKSFNMVNSTTKSGKTASDSALFTVAHSRDPVTQYAAARGLTLMRPLWKTWFQSEQKLTEFHYMDYPKAQALAQNFSDQLAIDAYASGSDSYVDIVALSARQVLGATDFAGTAEQPLLFLKEISSNGNSQTVDVIFPAFPFFLYTNPRWLGFLLEPHLEHMLSGQYPNKYTMHDLGTHYPNLTGHADGKDEYMPVEECGDMLIMGLALVNSLSYGSDNESQSLWAAQGISEASVSQNDNVSPFHLASLEARDGISGLDSKWGGKTQGVKQAQKWLSRSYPLWKQWTGYLVEFSLEPENQLCTDDFAGWLALQTNLALKGIIGIRAMSDLAALMGHDADATHYRNISETYIAKWEEYGISRDKTHAKLAYDWYGSWTTLYSLYADALLCFHPSSSDEHDSTHASFPYDSAHGQDQAPLLPSTGKKSSANLIGNHIYQMQSTWYASVMQKYGLPLDSRHLYAKSDWEFEAAAVASNSTRTEILSRVSTWLNETTIDRPFTDLYKTEEDGGFPGPNFFARPVVGAHFAFLTLERACGGRAMDGLKGLL